MSKKELVEAFLELSKQQLKTVEATFAELCGEENFLLERKQSLIAEAIETDPTENDQQHVLLQMESELSKMLEAFEMSSKEGQALEQARDAELEQHQAAAMAEYEQSKRRLIIEFEGKSVALANPPNVEDPALNEFLNGINKELDAITLEHNALVAGEAMREEQHKLKLVEMEGFATELAKYVQMQNQYLHQLEEIVRIEAGNNTIDDQDFIHIYECQKVKENIKELKKQIETLKFM